MPPPPLSEAELERRYPWIDWASPIPIRLAGTETSCLGCRFCIALSGMHADEIRLGAQSAEDFASHMAEVHRRPI